MKHQGGLDGRGQTRPLPGFDPWTTQPVASRYTDWAIAAQTVWRYEAKCNPVDMSNKNTTFQTPI